MGFLKFIQFHLIEKIQPYSAFHIVSFVIMIALCVALCVFCRNIKEKKLSRILMIIWGVLVFLEIYKQFVFSYEIVEGEIKWHYQWYVFPYQFCATPLTFIPFIALNKASNKLTAFVKEGAIAFCCTFNLFAGLAVMISPGDVFNTYNLGIDVHTMIHHGMQMVLGIYLYVYYHGKLQYWSYLKALPIFGFFLVNAMILNAIVPTFTNDTFNMFFISWKFPCTLPVLADIYPKVPYIIFLLIYIIGFAIAGFIIYNIIYWATFGVTKLRNKIAANKGKEESELFNKEKFDNTILEFNPVE